MSHKLDRPLRVCVSPISLPMNPGPGLLSDALLRTGRVTLSDYRYFSSLFTRFDIFHVHWPERSVFPVALPKRIAKVLLFLVFVYLCKARGGRVIWMANNIGSHEGASPRLERLLWRYFLPRVDHVIHLCPASADLIKNLAGPLPPGTVLAHPHYRPHFAALNSSAEPRLKLDLPKDSFVVGCFGSTRRYKGIDLLIGAMREWNRKDAVLLYGGPPISRELQKEIEALAGGDPRIKLFIRPLSDTELRDLIEASDVIAMPYRKILNSGVAMGAVSLESSDSRPGRRLRPRLRGASWAGLGSDLRWNARRRRPRTRLSEIPWARQIG